MERAFQSALWLLQPEVVFILGDIFDEGKWSSDQVGPGFEFCLKDFTLAAQMVPA